MANASPMTKVAVVLEVGERARHHDGLKGFGTVHGGPHHPGGNGAKSMAFFAIAETYE